MSWSVSAIGKAAAVKAALQKQFEGAKNSTQHIPAERESVVGAEASVGALLDGMADQSIVVKVAAHGSCGATGGILGSASMSIAFETLYGFVE